MKRIATLLAVTLLLAGCGSPSGVTNLPSPENPQELKCSYLGSKLRSDYYLCNMGGAKHCVVAYSHFYGTTAISCSW